MALVRTRNTFIRYLINEINADDNDKANGIIDSGITLIEEHLRGVLGVTKIPLAYIIRKEPAIPITVAANPL